jgi:hypothetical protein
MTINTIIMTTIITTHTAMILPQCHPTALPVHLRQRVQSERIAIITPDCAC